MPDIRFVPYADIWVPITTAKTDAYKREIMGGFQAVALARTGRDMPIIREEFNARLSRIELPDKAYKSLVAPFETQYDSFARESPLADRSSPDRQGSS